jgi:AraC-like DNA-binding protein
VLYLSYVPRPPLSHFVERLWLVAEGQSPRQERILPSGTIMLVVNLRDDRVRIEGTVDDARVRTCSGAAVSGAYSSVFIIDARQHAAMMGAHFKPGGASAVLGVPAGELTDAHVDLSALWGDAAARALRERLCEAATHQERFHLFERVLTARLQLDSKPQRHPVVLFALDCFKPNGLGASVYDVARRAGLSHRRFLTIFTNEVGLTPKLFCRVLRFQYMHSVAQRTGRIDWAQLALACGYSDQSHLSNEFRKLSGLSPTAYLRDIQEQRNLLRNHIAIL